MEQELQVLEEDVLYPKTEALNLTKNGVYNASDDGVDGYNVVNANVKYAPRCISFEYYNGTDLSEELRNLDVSNLNSAYQMFYECRNLTSLDLTLTNFNEFKGTSLYSMFCECNNLRELKGLETIPTDNVTSMSNMFAGCAATELNVNNWNVENVVEASNIFFSCNVEELDLSNWVGAKMDGIPQCSWSTNLKVVNLHNFSGASVTSSENIFEYCQSLISVDLATFNPPQIKYSFSHLFDGCKSLQRVDIRSCTFKEGAGYTSTDVFGRVPANCLIIVKDQKAKEWVQAHGQQLTNVVIASELNE